MQTILQHGCLSVSITSFEPSNVNALTISVETTGGTFDITLFDLPDSQVAKFRGLGRPKYGPDLPQSIFVPKDAETEPAP